MTKPSGQITGWAAGYAIWLSARLDADPAAFVGAAIDALLAKLVAMGIAEARRLEVRLQGKS